METFFLNRPPAPAPPAVGPRPWLRALVYLALLGPFFFATYGFANWYTGRLPHVGVLVFEWERRIPFWDWTILPYMSLDAFYAGSLLLCATRAELDTHARRLLAASAISVAGFLLFPLRFSFERPATSGFNGALFDALTGFDKPYNQAPSLHISLVLLVGLVFWRHVRGPLGWAVLAWFGLIALSVFTTYQHHFIDGVAGAAVGVAVVYLFPNGGWARYRLAGSGFGGAALASAAPAFTGLASVAPASAVPSAVPASPVSSAPPDADWRRTLALVYALGAGLCLGLAAWAGGWAWLLLWPGAALALVAAAYAGLGTAVFQKNADGQLSWAARWLLAPYQAGAWLSSRWFTRHGPPSAEVVPGLWLGRAPGPADGRHLSAGATLDLTAEFGTGRAARARPHRAVPLLDLVAPAPAALTAAVAALDALLPHPPVLVHCALGYSRSAVVVAAWLLHRGLAATPAEAEALVRAARPRVVLGAAHRAALAAFWATQPHNPLLNNVLVQSQ